MDAQNGVENGATIRAEAVKKRLRIIAVPTKIEFPRKLVVKNGIVAVLIVGAVIVLVLVSPFAVRWIATSQRDWVLLSNVRQTYGFAAALFLSGLAFIATAVSLFYQASPLEAGDKKSPQPISYQPLMTFATASATMAIISIIFRRRGVLPS